MKGFLIIGDGSEAEARVDVLNCLVEELVVGVLFMMCLARGVMTRVIDGKDRLAFHECHFYPREIERLLLLCRLIGILN